MAASTMPETHSLADRFFGFSLKSLLRKMAAAAGRVGMAGSLAEKCGSDPATDESSESEGETESSKAFHRRVSTSKAIKNGVCIKEGYLMKQTTSFQRWKRRYFKLKPRKLYYAKANKSVIFEEVDLTDLSLAECSPKNINHSFQLITPFRRLILCAETRKEMEEWMSALKSVSNKDFYEGADHAEFLSGQHNWYVASHARPTYCNVCKEALSGVTSHGLSCEVCKFKAHKRCAVKAANNCKWTTLSSVGKYIIEDESGNLIMPHQWLEGNLPVSGKCVVCDKTCGSVLRLQDWRCLWCRAMVHTSCRSQYPDHCPLGLCRTSVVPPTALHSIGNDESWEAIRPVGCSPLLVFVNSKSGDNQGVKFLRRFKQLLNPAQVFDLMNGGPELGIRMFKSFNPFRILVCGGDGSVSWVLTEIDKYHLHSQCQIGVLPLGTGNDLARVLGWGSVCDDDAQLPQLLEKYERATSKLLDRWSIMTYEGTLPVTRKTSSQYDPITMYEDSVVAHLTKILQSDQHSVVISSAKVLCETVKDFIAKVAAAQEGSDDEDSIAHKCAVLNEKLDSLLKTLKEESEASHVEEPEEPDSTQDSGPLMPECEEKKDSEKSFSQSRSRRKKTAFIQKEALMSRANSLKKAVRQIIEHTEKAVDEQNAQTQEREDQQQAGNMPNIVIEPDNNPSEETADSLKTPPLDSLPVFKTTSCDDNESSALPCWNPWGTPMGQSVGAPLKDTLQVTLPTIIGGASADSSPCPSPRPFLGLTPSPAYTPCSSPIPSDTGLSISLTTDILCPSTPNIHSSVPTDSEIERGEKRSPVHKPKEAPQSPKATRRISSGSTLKKMGHIGLQLSSYGLGVPPYPSQKEGSKRRLSEAEDPEKKDFPIINPLVSLPMWPNLNKDSLIGKVLLANSDVLCAAASPLMNVEETCLDGFEEKCVMNNYFGIGLDAKITLEFHNKREEHPEKCRSRTKNLMWYGVLGGKELLQRTFKNLEQKVQLECDGYRISLPSLQGIVVLNIPSYGGGSNFWGNPKEGEVFYVPTFDDKILEVLAVFGTVQMAASRVINLQHHRIAQCRSVKITILGDEGVPVQVDGEAWIQPPGYICLVHKNRTQVLCRNRQLESHLKTWQERQRTGNPNRSLPALPLAEDELQHLVSFVHVTASLVKNLKSMAGSNLLVEHELIPLALQTLNYMDKLFPSGKVTEGVVSRQEVSYFVASVRNLFWGTSKFIQEKIDETECASTSSDRLLALLNSVENEMKKCSESQGVVVFHGTEEEDQKKYSQHRGVLFKLKFKKQSKSTIKSSSGGDSTQVTSVRRSSNSSGGVPGPSCSGISPSSGNCGGAAGCGTPSEMPIQLWGISEVVEWLDSIRMFEYKDNFIKHDIHGAELLDLERRDLKELGITKVGHIKRILQAIKDISSLPSNR